MTDHTAAPPPSMLTLTEAEAAERLNLPLSWIAKARREHRIPHQKFGRHIRYTVEHLEAILKQFEVQAAGDPAGLTPGSRRHHDRKGRQASETDQSETPPRRGLSRVAPTVNS